MTTPADWCPPSPSPASDSEPGVPPTGDRFARRYATGVPELCARRLDPVMVNGLIVDFLRGQFAQAAADDPVVRKYVWDGQLGRSKLVVESAFSKDKAKAEHAPAIVVRPGDFGGGQVLWKERIAVKDRAGVTPAGHDRYAALWRGRNSVRVRHDNGQGCLAIGLIAQALLDGFGPKIESALGLSDFQSPSLGGLAEPKEDGGAPGVWTVDIAVGYALGRSWQLEYESVTLRTLDLAVLLDE